MKVFVSDNSSKRFYALFKDGKKVYFGSPGAQTYIDGASDAKRKAYLARHKVNENWNDPHSAGALSRFLLWEHRDLETAIKEYKRKFHGI